MKEATNAWEKAELLFKERKYDLALTNISAAVSQCAMARTNGDVALVGRLEAELNKRRTVVETAKVEAMQLSQFDTAMTETTNAWTRAEDAYKQKNYAVALSEIDSALKECETALKMRATPAVDKLKAVLGDRRGAIIQSKMKAQLYVDAMKQVTNAWNKGEEALGKTNYDGALAALEDALKQCQSARSDTENPADVDHVKGLLEGRRKMAQTAKDDRDGQSERYLTAMSNATNAWKRAKAAGTNYDGAITDIKQALTQCATAQTNRATVEVSQLVSALKNLQVEVQANKQKMELSQASDKARDYYNNGKYEEAMQICAQYRGDPVFDKLAGKVVAEQKILAEDTKKFETADYSFITDLKGNSYSNKKPFVDLLAKASEEEKALIDLKALQKASNWVAVQSTLAKFQPSRMQKTPFADLDKWARQQAAGVSLAKQATQTRLDTKLAELMVTLNVKRPDWLKKLEPKGAEVFGSNAMDEDTKTFYRQQVTDLENGLKREGLLEAEKRAEYVKTIRKRINDWGF